MLLCRFLVHEDALLCGERAALTGLLEDLHRYADGLSPFSMLGVPVPRRPYVPFCLPEHSQVPAIGGAASTPGKVIVWADLGLGSISGINIFHVVKLTCCGFRVRKKVTTFRKLSSNTLCE